MVKKLQDMIDIVSKFVKNGDLVRSKHRKWFLNKVVM